MALNRLNNLCMDLELMPEFLKKLLWIIKSFAMG
jgi:hypothetical protein